MLSRDLKIKFITSLCFVSSLGAENMTPQVYGDLWFSSFYSSGKKDLHAKVDRALLGVNLELDARWSLNTSYVGDVSGIRLNEVILKRDLAWSQDSFFELGRLKNPHFRFLERSFSYRWFGMRSLSEGNGSDLHTGKRSSFLDYRRNGVVVGDRLREAFEYSAVAATSSNAENDDTLSYLVGLSSYFSFVEDALGFSFSYIWEKVDDNALSDRNTRSYLSALHIENSWFKSLVEFNVQSRQIGEVTYNPVAYALWLDFVMGNKGDRFLVGILSGNDVYTNQNTSPQGFQYSLQGGPVFTVSKNLRWGLRVDYAQFESLNRWASGFYVEAKF